MVVCFLTTWDFFSSEERMIQMIKIFHGSLLAGSWGREHLNERMRMGEFFSEDYMFQDVSM